MMRFWISLVLLLAACGGSTLANSHDPDIRIRGFVQFAEYSESHGGAICEGAGFDGGTRITIIDDSGTVLGTAPLVEGSTVDGMCWMPFYAETTD